MASPPSSAAASSTGGGKARAVRRGNTSGLVGLWKAKEDQAAAEKTESSSSTLQIRQNANRRISFKEPPVSRLGIGASNNLRKTSEIVRPTFEKKRPSAVEAGSSRAFVSGILKEPRRISPTRSDAEDNTNEVVIKVPSPTNKRPASAALSIRKKNAAKPTLSKDDLALPAAAKKLAEEAAAVRGRRGSCGLGRSKSVKCTRVKFGLMIPSAAEDNNNKDVGGVDRADNNNGEGKRSEGKIYGWQMLGRLVELRYHDTIHTCA